MVLNKSKNIDIVPKRRGIKPNKVYNMAKNVVIREILKLDL